ncbi:MAG: hypothetical protein Q8Q42_03355 [Nanoarchaeota archaeon]|nr:hypothetical protein [Nanoarchaeota archaeon]
MAGENVVASGAIAVNLTLNDLTGGGAPGAPGAGGAPRTGAGGNKDAADYFARQKRIATDDVKSVFNTNKFLPMLGGVFGIAAIVGQSKIISGILGAFLSLFGAIVDIALIPLIPTLTKIIQGWSFIVNGFAVVMTDPLRALKNIAEFLKAIKEFFFGRPSGLETRTVRNPKTGETYTPTPYQGDSRMDVILDTLKFNLPFIKSLSNMNPIGTVINNIVIPALSSFESAEQVKAAAREGTKKALDDSNWERAGNN